MRRFACAFALSLALALVARAGNDASGDPVPAGARARLGTIRFRSTCGLTHVAWSPDGATVLTTDANMLRVFDRGGKVVHSFEPAQEVAWAISAISWSPDGKQVALASSLPPLVIWTPGAKEPRVIEGLPKGTNALAWSPDGKTIAAGGEYKAIQLVDLATGQAKALEGHEGEVKALAFSKDGKKLASGGEDKVTRIWDVAAAKEIAKLGNPDEVDEVAAVAFFPDGAKVATAGNQTVRIFDLASGAATALANEEGCTRSLAIAPDGKTLVSNALGQAVAWDVATSAIARKLDTGYDRVYDVAISPDGKSVAVAADPTLRIFDLASGKELEQPEGHRDFVNGLAFSPDGKTLATAGNDRALRLWEAATGKPTATIKEKEPIGCLAWSPDGKVLAAGQHASFDDNIVLHDAAGQVTGELALHKSWVVGLAFTPDGKQLVSGSKNDKLVALWDVGGRKLVHKLELPDYVNAVAVSLDGKLAAVAAGKTVHLLAIGATLAAGKKIDFDSSIDGLAFSKDGKRLAVGSNHLHVVELESGKKLFTHECDTFTRGAAWSPDGSLVACWSKNAHVADAATGKTAKTLEGHAADVLAGAFSPDGKLLATAGQDTTVLIWEVR